MKVIKIPFDQIKQFSDRDKAYHLNPEQFDDFIVAPPSYEHLKLQTENIKQFDYNRELLHQSISSQYRHLSLNAQLKNNIAALKEENTFTICTAHQLSLFSGPLYYIFKILSTVKLAQELNQRYPDIKIVPVFVHGGEDHDLEEINHLELYGKKIIWNQKATGATGRMSLDNLEEVSQQVFDILGQDESILDLKKEIEQILKANKNYGNFMFDFVHLLLGHLGIVQINMDQPELKAQFVPLIRKELDTSFSQTDIELQIDRLKKLGFKAQAKPRAINLFYLSEGQRNRIVRLEDGYAVIDTDLKFTREEILQELQIHPDRFSPNVVMRPLYQQLILPNLAYIGGGGELAYWLERKQQFENAAVFFPILIRRNSAALIDDKKYKQWTELELTETDLSQDLHQLSTQYLERKNAIPIDVSSFAERLKKIYLDLDTEIASLDATISKALAGEATKALSGLSHLENKIKKHSKQKEAVSIKRIEKIYNFLYPEGGLQERKSNILEFYNKRGRSLFDHLLEEMNPLDKDFKIFVLES